MLDNDDGENDNDAHDNDDDEDNDDARENDDDNDNDNLLKCSLENCFQTVCLWVMPAF